MAAFVILAAIALATVIGLWLLRLSSEAQIAGAQEAEAAAARKLAVPENAGVPSLCPDAGASASQNAQNFLNGQTAAEALKELQAEGLKGQLPSGESPQAQVGSPSVSEGSPVVKEADVQAKEQLATKEAPLEKTNAAALPTMAAQRDNQSSEPTSGSPVQGETALKMPEEKDFKAKELMDSKANLQTAQTVTQQELAGENRKKSLQTLIDEKHKLQTADEGTKDKTLPSEDMARKASGEAAQMDNRAMMQTAQTITQEELAGEDRKKSLQSLTDQKQQLQTADERAKDKTLPSEDMTREASGGTTQMDNRPAVQTAQTVTQKELAGEDRKKSLQSLTDQKQQLQTADERAKDKTLPSEDMTREASGGTTQMDNRPAVQTAQTVTQKELAGEDRKNSLQMVTDEKRQLQTADEKTKDKASSSEEIILQASGGAPQTDNIATLQTGQKVTQKESFGEDRNRSSRTLVGQQQQLQTADERTKDETIPSEAATSRRENGASQKDFRAVVQTAQMVTQKELVGEDRNKSLHSFTEQKQLLQTADERTKDKTLRSGEATSRKESGASQKDIKATVQTAQMDTQNDAAQEERKKSMQIDFDEKQRLQTADEDTKDTVPPSEADMTRKASGGASQMDNKATLQTAQSVTQKELVGEDRKKSLQSLTDQKQQLQTADEKTKDKTLPPEEILPTKGGGAAPADIAPYTAKLVSERVGDASLADKATSVKTGAPQAGPIREERTIIAEGTGVQETETIIEKSEMAKEKSSAADEKMLRSNEPSRLLNPKSYTGSRAESSGRTATTGFDTAKLDTEKGFEEETNKETRSNLVSGEKTPRLGSTKLADGQQAAPSPQKESGSGYVMEGTGTPVIQPMDQPCKVELAIEKALAHPEETASLISITATVVTDKNDWMLGDVEDMMKEDMMMQDLQKLGMENSSAINQRQADLSMRTAVDTISESKSSNEQQQK